MRIREHSDYGTITLLWQINDVPGPEVQDHGTWHLFLMLKMGLFAILVICYSVGLMITLKALNIEW